MNIGNRDNKNRLQSQEGKENVRKRKRSSKTLCKGLEGGEK